MTVCDVVEDLSGDLAALEREGKWTGEGEEYDGCPFAAACVVAAIAGLALAGALLCAMGRL